MTTSLSNHGPSARPVDGFDDMIKQADSRLEGEPRQLLESWPEIAASYKGTERVTKVRDKEIRTQLTTLALRYANPEGRAAALRR